jgi:hypothetical protein
MEEQIEHVSTVNLSEYCFFEAVFGGLGEDTTSHTAIIHQIWDCTLMADHEEDGQRKEIPALHANAIDLSEETWFQENRTEAVSIFPLRDTYGFTNN